jgi:cell division protein FtsB
MRKAGSGDRMKPMMALVALLALTGIAVAGPTGLLAWSENVTALEQREAEIAKLSAQRDALRNRVRLLDPEAADPDLASELVREQLGVIHEDDVVITLEDEAP